LTFLIHNYTKNWGGDAKTYTDGAKELKRDLTSTSYIIRKISQTIPNYAIAHPNPVADIKPQVPLEYQTLPGKIIIQ
jgi:hypothetical protein